MLVFIHIRSRVLSPVTERNMGTKENNLVRLVLDQVQIGFQPIILLIQKSGFTLGTADGFLDFLREKGLYKKR